MLRTILQVCLAHSVPRTKGNTDRSSSALRIWHLALFEQAIWATDSICAFKFAKIFLFLPTPLPSLACPRAGTSSTIRSFPCQRSDAALIGITEWARWDCTSCWAWLDFLMKRAFRSKNCHLNKHGAMQKKKTTTQQRLISHSPIITLKNESAAKKSHLKIKLKPASILRLAYFYQQHTCICTLLDWRCSILDKSN